MPDNPEGVEVANGKSTMTPEAAVALFAMVNSVPQRVRNTLRALMLEILAAQEKAFKAWHDLQIAELRKANAGCGADISGGLFRCGEPHPYPNQPPILCQSCGDARETAIKLLTQDSQ